MTEQRICAMCRVEPTTSATAMYGKKCQRILRANMFLSGNQKKLPCNLVPFQGRQS